MTRNTTEQINHLDTRFWLQQEEHWQELRILQADMQKAKADLECMTSEMKMHKTKIHLRLENENLRFTFLVDHVDHQTWSALKKFVERMIDENFQQLPKPERKRAKCTADEDESRNHTTQKDNDNTREQTKMMNMMNTDETETNYDDYSGLDLILPPEGSPRPMPNKEVVKIPGLEDLDCIGNE